MVLAAVAGLATSMRAGSLRKVSTSRWISLRHGGREEQRLPARRQQLADALDVRDEAHVEHAVGFVDDQDLDAGEQDLAAPEVIEQAAGRGDQHVDAAVELAAAARRRRRRRSAAPADSLWLIPYFSKLCATCAASSRVGARISERGMRARALPASSRASIGSTIAGGLAGAGLGDAEHVAPAHCNRDGLDLNGGRLGIAGGLNGSLHFCAEP